MLSADALALLRACRANPADDTARLVLADQLEEYCGMPGAAAYIRADVEHARARMGNLDYRESAQRRNAHRRPYLDFLRAVLCGHVRAVREDEFVIAENAEGEFVWGFYDLSYRRCSLRVERGLPATIRTTLPLLVDGAKRLFLFPLMACNVTDRAPERDHVPGVGMDVTWIWVYADYPQKFHTWEMSPTNVPRPIYHRLPQPVRYRRKADAREALNAAALQFGRAAVAEPLPA